MAKGNVSKEEKIDLRIAELKGIQASLKDTQVPLGWQEGDGEISCGEVFRKVLGLLFSVVAGIVGAPFWFQTLNKLVNLRGTGAKPKD